MTGEEVIDLRRRVVEEPKDERRGEQSPRPREHPAAHGDRGEDHRCEETKPEDVAEVGRDAVEAPDVPPHERASVDEHVRPGHAEREERGDAEHGEPRCA